MHDIVSYEEAEMLAKLFDYRGKCTHYYNLDDKEVKEHTQPMDFNTSKKCWAGMDWKYGMYSAPTKSEAILWLMDKLDFLMKHYGEILQRKEDKIRELEKEIKKIKLGISI